jgi:hypothetical protein
MQREQWRLQQLAMLQNSWLPSHRDIAAAQVSNRMSEVLIVSGDNPETATQIPIQQCCPQSELSCFFAIKVCS